MAPDVFEEVTSEGFFSRLKNAIGGILFGLLLFVGAIVLLFYNEGRAVSRAKALEEGGAMVISVASKPVEPANEGKLIHISGLADTQQVLADPDFGVKLRALRLARTVEIYQWQQEEHSETEKKLGGGTVTKTTYTYKKDWSEGLKKSSNFKHPEGHENPGMVPFSSKTWTSDKVSVGDFHIPESLVGRIGTLAQLTAEAVPAALSRDMGGRVRIFGEDVYIGKDPYAPAVGDLKVSFGAVAPSTISVVAKQTGNSLASFKTPSGGSIELLEDGTLDAASMFTAAEKSNAVLTWILRALGYILMSIGLFLVLRPLSVLLDVIPLLGSIAGAGLGFVSLLVSLALSFVVIAVAWLFYRPLLGIGLLVLGIGIGVLVIRSGRKKTAAKDGGSLAE